MGHHGHAGPRRLRRGGGARPEHVRRRAAGRGLRGGAQAADALRAGQGPPAGDEGPRGGEQDRSARGATGLRRGQGLRPHGRAGGLRRADRLHDGLRLGPQGDGGAGSRGGAHGHDPALRRRARAHRPARRGHRRRERPPVPRQQHRLRQLQGEDGHRADHERLRPGRPGRGAGAARPAEEDGTARKPLRVRQPRQARGGGRVGRRDHHVLRPRRRRDRGPLITNEGGGAEAAEPLPPIAVELPTVRMTLGVNKSPLAGREGKFLTSRMIRDRLFKELDRNVALQVEETESADKYAVSGRGQLHLTVLIETMCREGFELEVGPPVVIDKMNEETGKLEEPWESVEVRVPDEYSGAVIDLLNSRKGELTDMGLEENMQVVKYLVPTRGMLGLRSSLLSSTRGTAIIDSVFDSYRTKI